MQQQCGRLFSFSLTRKSKLELHRSVVAFRSRGFAVFGVRIQEYIPATLSGHEMFSPCGGRPTFILKDDVAGEDTINSAPGFWLSVDVVYSSIFSVKWSQASESINNSGLLVLALLRCAVAAAALLLHV